MKIINTFIAVAAFTTAVAVSPALSQEMKTYEVDSWPAGITSVPCDAWMRKPDGSWQQIVPIKNGNNIINAFSPLANTDSARMLDARCRGKH